MRTGYEGGLWGCDSGPQWDLKRAKELRLLSIEAVRRHVARGDGCWCDEVAQAIIDPAGFVSEYGWNEEKLLKAYRLGRGVVSLEVCKQVLTDLAAQGL